MQCSLHVEEAFVFCWSSFADKKQHFTKIDQERRKIWKICIWNAMTTRFITYKPWFTSSVWNLCRLVPDVPPRETSPAAKGGGKRMFSQAIFKFCTGRIARRGSIEKKERFPMTPDLLKDRACIYLALENSEHFATPPLAPRRDDVWGTSAEIPPDDLGSDLLSAADWLIENVLHPIRRTCYQYGISALVSQTSFR